MARAAKNTIHLNSSGKTSKAGGFIEEKKGVHAISLATAGPLFADEPRDEAEAYKREFAKALLTEDPTPGALAAAASVVESLSSSRFDRAAARVSDQLKLASYEKATRDAPAHSALYDVAELLRTTEQEAGYKPEHLTLDQLRDIAADPRALRRCFDSIALRCDAPELRDIADFLDSDTAIPGVVTNGVTRTEVSTWVAGKLREDPNPDPRQFTTKLLEGLSDAFESLERYGTGGFPEPAEVRMFRVAPLLGTESQNQALLDAGLPEHYVERFAEMSKQQPITYVEDKLEDALKFAYTQDVLNRAASNDHARTSPEYELARELCAASETGLGTFDDFRARCNTIAGDLNVTHLLHIASKDRG